MSILLPFYRRFYSHSSDDSTPILLASRIIRDSTPILLTFYFLAITANYTNQKRWLSKRRALDPYKFTTRYSRSGFLFRYTNSFINPLCCNNLPVAQPTNTNVISSMIVRISWRSASDKKISFFSLQSDFRVHSQPMTVLSFYYY